MSRFNAIRLLRTVFNSSNYKGVVDRYKNYKYPCRLLNTESKLDFGKNNVAVRNDEGFLKAAEKIGLDVSDLVDHQALQNVSKDHLLVNASVLLNFGFKSDTVIEFLKEFTSLFRLKTTELESSLGIWMQLGINEDLLIELLSKHPQFIELAGPSVQERISYLMPYFEKEKTVAILLINVPGVIYENWSTLKAKLDFLNSHNIPMRKVASCSALELSLVEIKTRFTFLERAGLYKRRIDLLKKDVKVKNPSVNNILCTSDQLFAETIGKLTLVEYEAFCELYTLELEFSEEGHVDEEDSE